MKFVLECSIFSDGSAIISSKPGFSSSGAYRFLIRDIISNSYWSGVNSDHQTEVAVFISRLNLPKNKSII